MPKNYHHRPISAYTYVRCASEMGYPFLESITSFVEAGIDEVVVLDVSEREDEGTQDLVLDLVDKYPDVVRAFHADVDWTVPNFGIWDGKSKAIARQFCSNQHLIQFDVDEILDDSPDTMEKLQGLIATQARNNKPLITLPVVEYWGSTGTKVRMDINPWKERISINDPNITHGIPGSHRYTSKNNGLLYSLPGSDGCNMIYKDNLNTVPLTDSMGIDGRIQSIQREGYMGDEQSRQAYETWFNQKVSELPTIFHFSWWTVAGKIKKYQKFFNSFWPSLYGNSGMNPCCDGRNPFFPGWKLEEVTDEMIEEYARDIERISGGHIFHSPWDGAITNSVTISSKPIPKIMEDWCRENG